MISSVQFVVNIVHVEPVRSRVQGGSNLASPIVPVLVFMRVVCEQNYRLGLSLFKLRVQN